MAAELPTAKKQLLHLVLGGELTELGGSEFKDLEKIDIVGVFSNYMPAPMSPGSPRRNRLSTMPTCAISSFTCIACSTPKPQVDRYAEC